MPCEIDKQWLSLRMVRSAGQQVRQLKGECMKQSKAAQLNAGVQQLKKLTGVFHYVTKHKGFYGLMTMEGCQHSEFGADAMIAYIQGKITALSV